MNTRPDRKRNVLTSLKDNLLVAHCGRRLTLTLIGLALAGAWPARTGQGKTSFGRPSGPERSVAMGTVMPSPVGQNWLALGGLKGLLGYSASSGVSPSPVAAIYGRLPLSFEANVGQSDSRVRFLAHGPGYTLFLTPNGQAVLVSAEGDRARVVRMELGDANPQPEVQGLDEQAAKSYYFVGNDPGRWQRRVANYGRVCYRAVYPGVDLVYYGNGRRLEHDWVIAPRADPTRIRLRFVGGAPPHVNLQSGDLELGAAQGKVCLHKPLAYQVVNGDRVAVEARYVLEAGNQVRFALGPYDAARTLVIDPALSYSTYLGGTSFTTGFGIAVDLAGNAYVTGQTTSPDFPLAHPLPGPINHVSPVSLDAFVSKLSFDARSGTLNLVYSTYLGGSDNDEGLGIAVDRLGDAYVVGNTASSDFPLVHPLATPKGLPPGGIFVSKLAFDARSGTLSLAYSTHLGGSGTDQGFGIAVDWAGNAYVTVRTESPDFPLAHPLPASVGGLDGEIFVSKLSFDACQATLALAYSTHFGNSAIGTAIAVDWAGNAYLTGYTDSVNFPLVHPLPAPNDSLHGGLDAFVSKLSFDAKTTTLSLVYSTYLGGNDLTAGSAIAADLAGNAYIAGYTNANGFPLVHPLPAPNNAFHGVRDAFMSKLSFDARSGTLNLVYSTYLGGSADDEAQGIAVDVWGNAYVTGYTSSPDFPLVRPLPPPNNAFKGGEDAFVSKLRFDARTGTLALAYSTFLGGSEGEEAYAIAVDLRGNAYVTGQTSSSDFPLSHPLATPNNVLRGFNDAFVSKIAPSP